MLPRLAVDSPASRPLPRRINFTKDALAGIRCPAGKTAAVVYDTKTQGLAFRVREGGGRAFYWIGRVRGELRPVKHLIGPDATPIDLARRIATEASVKAAQGVHPTADVKAKREAARAQRTLGDLWEAYRVGFLETRATQKTRETNESLWRVWLSPLGDRAADTVNGEALRALHASIAKGKADPKTKRSLGGKRTANKCVAMLRRLYNFNRLPNPVTRGVVELYRQHSRERYLLPDELRRFFAALADEPDETARDFLLLALFTGARRGNVSSMRWAEIDPSARLWRIPAAKSKTGKPIDVPLHPAAVELIERRRTANARREVPSDFVLWSDRAAAGHISEPRYAMQRVCKAARIGDLTIHDLRRTMGSWQAAAGASLTIIGKSLGHANESSTKIYARVDLAPVQESMFGAVDAMLRAANEPPFKSR